jgi:hypothetical protein
MANVGQIVQEAMDLMNSGSFDAAMRPTAIAIAATTAKATGKEPPGELDVDRFLKDNWALITFMGMPRALPLPMNIPFGLKRIIPTFNSLHGAPEIISLVVNRTLQLGLMPAEFGFNTTGTFEIKDGKMLLPIGLVCGLLGSVIFHPSNSGESIGDHYWISISDFKMFVSELFGRKDLADRIMKFYLD